MDNKNPLSQPANSSQKKDKQSSSPFSPSLNKNKPEETRKPEKKFYFANKANKTNEEKPFEKQKDFSPPPPAKPPLDKPLNQPADDQPPSPPAKSSSLGKKKISLLLLGFFILVGTTLAVFKISQKTKIPEMFPGTVYEKKCWCLLACSTGNCVWSVDDPHGWGGGVVCDDSYCEDEEKKCWCPLVCAHSGACEMSVDDPFQWGIGVQCNKTYCQGISSPSPSPILVSPSPSPGEPCPTDVTPYVSQTGSLPSGYAKCNNGGHKCITLNLPPEYADCTYKAEEYTDEPQNCTNQEAHNRQDMTIGNGGSICFSNLPIGDDCKSQIDIRYDQPGAPAGNIKTYKINCGGTQTSPSPSPSSSPSPSPSSSPSPSPSSSPSPGTECTECASLNYHEINGQTYNGQTIELGDQVSFRCRSNGNIADSFEFQYIVSNIPGADSGYELSGAIPSNPFFSCMGSECDAFSNPLPISSEGDYLVQCRVCQGGKCTQWGQADGCGGSCTPNCSGKECGDDGCGGSCGSCGNGESCSNGQCKATTCYCKVCQNSLCVTKEFTTCPCVSECSSISQCIGGGGGGGGCFLTGTQVNLSNNQTLNIEDIKAGDQVLAFDSNNQLKKAKVVDLFKKQRNSYLILSTEKDNQVKVTKEHPFLTEKGFVPADQLKTGQKVLLKENNQLTTVKITDKKIVNKTVDVYNLQVDSYHTFFANQFAVHNKTPICFLKNTKITLANNENINIEEVKTNDQVLSFNQNLKLEKAKITNLFQGKTDSYFILSTYKGHQVKVTSDHPFLTLYNQFKKAKDLKTNDQVYILKNNKLVLDQIISKEKINKTVPVYNLSVDTSNTFFANQFAVHNKPIVK